MEAWRRQLDEPVRAFPIAKAGPAHVATLKTFDPPLSVLEGRRLAGARRRAKRLLLPTDDGELVLLVHLMTAGRLKYLRAGEKGPKTPAFALELQRERRRLRPLLAGAQVLQPSGRHQVHQQHELAVVRREEQPLRAPARAREAAALQHGERRVERLQRRDVRRPGLRDRERAHRLVELAPPRLHLRQLWQRTSLPPPWPTRSA